MSRPGQRTARVAALRNCVRVSKAAYERSVTIVGEPAIEARKKAQDYERRALGHLDWLEASGDLGMLAEMVAAEERADAR